MTIDNNNTFNNNGHGNAFGNVSKSAFVKTYVLIVSKTFPKTHSKSGKHTFFIEKINEAKISISETPIMGSKIHTLRGNYQLWKKRIDEIQKGKAILSLRFWIGKPYNSKQVEFLQLDKSSGIGIQGLYFDFNRILEPFISSEDSKNELQTYLSTHEIARNDGLNYLDFKEWFKGYDLNEPMAIIHFTAFRY